MTRSLPFVSAAAVLLLLTVGAETWAARPLDLIYTAGPYPGRETSYVSCEKPEAAQADYCVPTGTWTGLCAKKAPDAPVARFDGPLFFQGGVPRIDGCEERVLLLWKRQGNATPAYQPPKVGAQEDGKGFERVELNSERQSSSVVLREETLRLEVTFDAKGKGLRRVVDLRDVLGDAVTQARTLRLVPVGDVTGDGAPEVIVALLLKGYTKDFESRWSVPVAAMVTLSDPPRVMGFSSGSAGKVYGPKHCTDVGCDVIAYLDDKESCDHFAGEEPYDEERRREIEEGLRGCDALPARRKALLRKYRDTARVTKALKAAPGE